VANKPRLILDSNDTLVRMDIRQVKGPRWITYLSPWALPMTALAILLVAGDSILRALHSGFLEHYLPEGFTEVATILGAVAAVAAATTGLLKYLDVSKSRAPKEGGDSFAVPAIVKLISDVAALKATGPATPSAEALKGLRDSITTELVQEIESRVAVEAQRKLQFRLIRRHFKYHRGRLREEISNLTQRGNLNLVIGVLTTGAAAAYLGFLVVRAPSHFANMTDVWTHYLPRLSTVIFIEVFAFFFLRLYKNTMLETRYYHNVLTELATFEITLEAAFIRDDPATISAVLGNLSKPKNAPSIPALDGEATGIDYKDLAALLEKFGKLALQAKSGKE
jgi:hypothetical protein